MNGQDKLAAVAGNLLQSRRHTSAVLATGLSAHVCIHPHTSRHAGLMWLLAPWPHARRRQKPRLLASTELLENHVEEVVLPVLLAQQGTESQTKSEEST